MTQNETDNVASLSEFISLIHLRSYSSTLEMSKQKDSDLETENKELKCENETLKLEIVELRETNDKLKQSLDKAVRSKPKPSPRVQRPTTSQSPASPGTADHELRKLIKDLQDRLTIAEQVTAATQKRELKHAYQNIPTKRANEVLRFDPTQVHIYTALQKTTHAGCITVFS